MKLRQILCTIASKPLTPQSLRDALYHKALDVGSCGFRERIYVNNAKNLHIGNACFIGRGIEFYNSNASVFIDDNVMIAPNVHFYTTSHKVCDSERRTAGIKYDDIRVEKGCWIGADAVLLQGVTIAPGCIVGSGAVVTGSTEPNGLYAGVPARRVKELD